MRSIGDSKILTKDASMREKYHGKRADGIDALSYKEVAEEYSDRGRRTYGK